jgi:hypothetical protein
MTAVAVGLYRVVAGRDVSVDVRATDRDAALSMAWTFIRPTFADRRALRVVDLNAGRFPVRPGVVRFINGNDIRCYPRQRDVAPAPARPCAHVKLTHSEVVDAAAGWLRAFGCRLVFTEPPASVSRHSPDAVGWKIVNRGWDEPAAVECHHVECKVSRGDFRADSHKPSRRGGWSMGTHRWYLVPEGMVSPDETGAWGLLVIGSDGVQVLKRPEVRKRRPSEHPEVALLVKALRRVGA